MPQRSDRQPSAADRLALIARRLRAVREIVCPVQSDAARAAGETAPTWNRYERGGSRVDILALASFCDAYDVTTDFILRGTPVGLRHEVLIRLLKHAPELVPGSTELSLSGGEERSAERQAQMPSGNAVQRRTGRTEGESSGH